MVLAEVPLWVSHGGSNPSNNASNNSADARLPGLGGVGGAATATANDVTVANNTQKQKCKNDVAIAKSALSLLTSTRGGGSGGNNNNRAPMYSIDVHPDGSRFATAGGDGSVKIWSVSSLFAGKLLIDENDDKEGRAARANKKLSSKMKSSRFTDNGNYVSSNSEEYYDDDDYNSNDGDGGGGSSSDELQQQTNNHQSSTNQINHQSSTTPQQQQQQQLQAGVNDLSGLVRKKKGGNNKKAAAPPAAAAASTTVATAVVNNPFKNDNKEGTMQLSPLSRLTQNNNNPTISNNNASNTINNNNNTANKKQQPQNKHKQHKLLSTINSHEGSSVLCLRFSPSGLYLATAGDDSYVNIYKRSNLPSLAKGNLDSSNTNNNKDVEHWNRIAICRGHHLDVVGLAWAPDDSHLVSCSLDSHHPVIVWRLFDVFNVNGSEQQGGGANAAGGSSMLSMGGGMMSNTKAPTAAFTTTTVHHIHTLHPYKVLGRDIHTSTVKGVAFDPAGKYLASSGDDPAICIWRAFDDWGLEARVDSSSGVFRSKKRKVNHHHGGGGDNETSMMMDSAAVEDDPGELASLSLFRRISFAPDGSHVCGTNATLRGKNIAAMISREGWAASGPSSSNKKLSSTTEGGGDNVEGGNSGNKAPPGAANLVGHKQPVVASRHCPVFFTVPKKKKKKSKGRSSSSSSEDGSSSSSESSEDEDDDPDAEPEYATLVALGDKRGFVTVWSTKMARPLFKMQCSESRCQVTDISWGLVRRGRSSSGRSNNDDISDNGGGDSLVMIVSLLDGYVVALHFDIPNEVGGGQILPSEKTRQIFRLKYGIDDFVGNYCFSPGKKQRSTKRLVDDAGPMLIENALQLTMEMEAEAGQNDIDGGGEDSDNVSGEEGKAGDVTDGNQAASSVQQSNVTCNIKDKQVESTKSGKKRIRPVLMSVNNDGTVAAAPTANNVSEEDNNNANGGGKKRQKKSKDDSLQSALDAASKAASAAEGVSAQPSNRAVRGGDQQNAAARTVARPLAQSAAAMEAPSSATSLGPAIRIPYSTNKIFSVDLTNKSTMSPPTNNMLSASVNENGSTKIVADCTNSTASTSSWPFATLTLSCGGVKQWKDIIVKARCTALAANKQLLVVGTADGCLYLYGTSSTLGWQSGKSYRAFPPFVLGSPVVEICMTTSSTTTSSCEMVVVTSDGNFFVYTLLPSGPKLNYKGSIIPAMQHMYLSSLSASVNQQHRVQPKMARIQITDSKQLMLILVLPQKQSSSASAGGGKTLQGFIYNRDMELWMRVSDSSNFLLSDFYSPLPGGTNSHQQQGAGGTVNVGTLANMDRLVRSSASMASAKQMFQRVASSESNGTTNQNIVTRSHCEDRLACAIALGSAVEFQTWLKHYALCLSSAGDADGLRFLVDIILGSNDSPSIDGDEINGDGCTSNSTNISSFLAVGRQSLSLDGKDIVRKSILPEMSKNRMLQRLTNEISMELECL